MSLANCQYGFDAAVISGFQAMVGFLMVFGYRDETTDGSPLTGWNIATQPQQLISSTLNIGTIIGVIFTGFFGRYFGRRPAIWLASLIAFAGAGVQVAATTVPVLCVGRVLIGISNAFFFTFSNIYCVESTPAHLRAVVTSFFGIWASVGSLLGAVADQQSQTHKSKLAYQIPLATLFAIPLSLSILVFFIPESPRWLMLMDRRKEARESLARLRGGSLAAEFFEEEYTEMARGIEQEKALASSKSVFSMFKDMFHGPDLRRTIIVGGVVLSHSSSGLWLFIAYSVCIPFYSFFFLSFFLSLYQLTHMMNQYKLTRGIIRLFSSKWQVSRTPSGPLSTAPSPT